MNDRAKPTQLKSENNLHLNSCLPILLYNFFFLQMNVIMFTDCLGLKEQLDLISYLRFHFILFIAVCC